MAACTFIGHKDAPYEIKEKVCEIIDFLITSCCVDSFYIGTHGRFDRMVYDVLCQLEIHYKIKIFVVLAYINEKTEWVDLKKTIFPALLDNTPPKYAISKRNLYMIEQSKYMICYVDNTQTNSYVFAEKAVRKGLTLFNLGQVVF